MFYLWERGWENEVACMMLTRCGIMLNALLCTCYDVWMQNVFSYGKVNPWLLLRKSSEVESLIACWKWRICISSNSIEEMLLLGSITQESVVIWSDPGFIVAEDGVVSCYLVGSRFHGNLLGDVEVNCYLVRSRADGQRCKSGGQILKVHQRISQHAYTGSQRSTWTNS